MQNELVQLTTQDVSKAVVVATSRLIAEKFEKDHKSVLRAIRNQIQEIESTSDEDGYKVAPIYYVNKRIYLDSYGRENEEYEMNQEFFMLVAMGFQGKKALIYKTRFIEAFQFMKRELMARVETRKIGKRYRLSLTDSIKNHVEEKGNFKKFAYSNYTKLVYKRVLGKDVKTAKADRRVPEEGNIRDYLTMEELDQVQDLESKIAGFIEVSDTTGKNDKQIYAMVKEWIDGKGE